MTTISAENITLVTVVTFLGVFFTLTLMIPPGLLASPQEGRTVNVPAYFEGIDLQSYANTKVINLTQGGNALEIYDFKFGGWNMKLEDWGSPQCFIWIRTQAEWWIFEWDLKYFKWFNCKGIEKSRNAGWIGEWHDHIVIDYSALDEAFEEYGKEGLKWRLENDNTQMVVYVGFNQTKYSKPSEALNGGELSLLLCMNFDKMNTSFNAWNLIGSILFFQMPNVHPLINVIIAIPIWILIAWLIYTLILKALPFVG